MRLIVRAYEIDTDNLSGTVDVFDNVSVLSYDSVKDRMRFILPTGDPFLVIVEKEYTKKTFGFDPDTIVTDPYFFKSHDDIFVVGIVYWPVKNIDENDEDIDWNDGYGDEDEFFENY